MIVFAFTWKNPVGLMIASTAFGSAWARARGSGYRLKSSGVTAFTDRSVVWADRMVAISISKGLRWTSSEIAG